MSEATLTIGELAREAEVAASAVRYYERVGLLPEAVRVSGQRRFGPDSLRRLEVIAIAKQAGFTLDDIRTLLQSTDAGAAAAVPLREFANRKLPDVEALIERAESMRAWLQHAQVCNCRSLDGCGLFERVQPDEASEVRT